MLHARQHGQHSLELADRRAHKRLDAASVIFVRLDDRNGGTVLNLSEDGLALSAVRTVEQDELPYLRIQFPETSEWIQASAQVVWRSESKKEAGVRFVGLSEQARQQILAWISAQGASAESRESTEPVVVRPIRNFDEVAQEVPRSPVEQPKTEFEEVDRRGRQSTTGLRTRERRSRTRTRIVPLGYLQLGEGNGGIALNVSEDGLAITAGGILIDDHLPSIRLLFPDTDDWIETAGEIVWRSESKKEAGIRFTKLTEEVRRQIRDWVSTQPFTSEMPVDVESVEDKTTETKLAKVADNSVPVEPTIDAAAPPVAVKGSPKEESVLPVPEPFALPELDLPALVPQDSDSSEEYGSHDLPPLPPKRASRKLILTAVPGAVFFLLAASFVLRRHTPAGVKTEISKPVVSEKVASAASPPAAIPSGPPPAEVTRGTNANPEPSTSPEDTDIRPSSKANSPSFVAKQQIPTVTAVRSPAKQTTVAPPNAMDQATRITDWGTSHPITSAPLKTAGTTPTAGPPQLDNGAVVSATASSNSPNALYADLTKKETPPAAPKQPEAPASRSGKVEVQADPYPSIRLAPQQKAKKGAKANSLQLGHLLARVNPVYPEEAKQQGIEGTVKVHAVIGRDGSVQQVDADGPPALVAVVKNAVRQWRYTQTLVGGQAVETDENIDVTFRLSNK